MESRTISYGKRSASCSSENHVFAQTAENAGESGESGELRVKLCLVQISVIN